MKRDFPGGPVVKTPCSPCRGCRFDPLSGNSDPACLGQKKKNIVKMTPFVLYILCHNLIFFKPIRIPSEPWDKCPPSFLALLLRIRKQMDSGYKRWFCLSFSGWPWAGDSPGVIFYQAGLAIKFWNQSPLDCFISLGILVVVLGSITTLECQAPGKVF